jgi:hypothetical protein
MVVDKIIEPDSMHIDVTESGIDLPDAPDVDTASAAQARFWYSLLP